MTQFIGLLIAGMVLLVLFLFSLLGNHGKDADASSMARLTQVVPLVGLGFKHPQLLFRDDDHKWLNANRSLRSVARLHRRDRRRMVLQWLRLVQSDLFVLWRFRRLLAGFGVSAGAYEEVLVFLKAAFVLTLLLFLRTLVWLAGPFVAIALLRGCQTQVEALFRSCAGLLPRIPAAAWPEIEERCVVEFRRQAAA